MLEESNEGIIFTTDIRSLHGDGSHDHNVFVQKKVEKLWSNT